MLEIGANVGTDTVRMLEAFPGATMHCFEPDPRAYAALTDRVSGTRARCYQQAVAATNGPLTFHQSSGERPGVDISIPGGWHASGSIHAPKVHLTEYCDRELYEGQVPLKRLLKMLPGWRLVRQYEWDVLLENVALRSARG